MTFIRKRTTKNGVVSTALVEACRDKGKPRQRLIANLRGAETLVAALGQLAAERDELRKERDGLDLDGANRFYEDFTSRTMAGEVWTAEDRKLIDRCLRDRRRLLKRIEQIDKLLARIQREGAVIKKHCKASAEEIRAEASKHLEHIHRRKAGEVGMKLMMSRNRDRFIRRFMQS